MENNSRNPSDIKIEYRLTGVNYRVYPTPPEELYVTCSIRSNQSLLAAVPGKDRQRFLSACEPVTLVVAQILAEPGERMREVYFPTASFISLVTLIDGEPGLEVGLVGNEGMLGISNILGIGVSPLHAHRVQDRHYV